MARKYLELLAAIILSVLIIRLLTNEFLSDIKHMSGFSLLFSSIIMFMGFSMIHLAIFEKIEITFYKKYGDKILENVSKNKINLLNKLNNVVYAISGVAIFPTLLFLVLSNLEGITKEFIYNTNFSLILISLGVVCVFSIQVGRIIDLLLNKKYD